MEEENRHLKDSLANFEQRLLSQRVGKEAETQQPEVSAGPSQSREFKSVYTPESWDGSRREERQTLNHSNDSPLDLQHSDQIDTLAQSHGPTSAATDEIASNVEMTARGNPHHAEELEPEALRNALFANSARLSTSPPPFPGELWSNFHEKV